ncbi:hypothetical protein [Acuticoccus kandeliae]|uniref:hypothetical protein n=1 Tax=Acuticoccus kandeliae TaxID=2073160 RepID=UPI000D3E825B|nr:hypothetical protein [Acuticoccus kandeliae]
MARIYLMAALAGAAMIGGDAALAQSYDQYQNRLQLQNSQRSMQMDSYQRDQAARQQDTNVQNRIERQNLQMQLNSPSIFRQPPVVTPTTPVR